MKKIKIVAVLLALVAIVSGFLHMNSRDDVVEGSILIEYKDQQLYLQLSPDAYEDVKGEVVNGKGEVLTIDSKGIPLVSYLSRYQDTDYQQVTVVADDAYEAVVTREEVEEDEKVYLLVEDDSYTLIVFGDSNSKRNVRKVVKLVVE